MRALQLAALALLVATTSASYAQDGSYCPSCNSGSCGSSKGGFLNCGNWFKRRKSCNCESCQASQGYAAAPYAAAPYAGETYTGNQYPGGYVDDPNGPGLGPNGTDGGAYGPAGYGGPGGPMPGYGGATRYPVRGTPGYPHHHYAREYQGPQGPSTAQVAYPYYTTRGPRDFLMNNPPSIGR